MAKSTFTILLLTVFVSLSVYSQKYYVPDDYPSILSAIDAVADHDTIIVRPGIYYENLNYTGKNLHIASMIEETGDEAYIDSTIIDGSDLDRVVVFENGEDSTSVLRGFTIQNGYAFRGGGIYCYITSPGLFDLKVINNRTHDEANSDGGGIYLTHSHSVINRVLIDNNTAYEYGGGIVIRNRSYVTLDHVTITNNVVSSPENHGKGGGAQIDFNTVCTIKNTVIANNSAANWGGGISVGWAADVDLINVTITGNTAGNGGGGIYTAYEYTSYFLGNTICYNNLPDEIFFDPTCDFVDLSVCYSDIRDLANLNSTPGVLINILEGNIDEDPLFTDPANEDYTLDTLSPCIDAGINYYYYQNQLKIDIAEDLYFGVMPDMGAFEYESPCFIYVPDDYTEIQQAINAAEDVCTIIVRPGIYYENLNLLDKNIILTSLYHITGDSSAINTTIIDGFQNGSVLRIDGGQDTSCVIKGFTIRNGNNEIGAGILVINSSPILTDLIVKENTTPNYESYACGGGVRFGYSDAVIRNSIIENNWAYDYGAGIGIRSDCNVKIENCTIRNNELGSGYHGKGGGIYIDLYSYVEISRTLIYSNSARWGGGVATGSDANVRLLNVTVFSNSAYNGGAGLYSCYNNTNCYVGNSILWDNFPNEVLFGDGGYNNTLYVLHSDIEGGLTGIQIEGGALIWLEGNINQRPQFTDAYGGDFSLTNGSPCIDTGIDFYTIGSDTLINIPRSHYNGLAPDMGAIESDYLLIQPERQHINSSFVVTNPVSDELIITFHTEMPENIRICLFDVSGKVVKQLPPQGMINKNEKLHINTSDLTTGIYFLRLSSSGNNWSEKIIVL